MTPLEARIIHQLGDCYKDFTTLPQLHPDDEPDFRFHIHALQNMMAMRSTVRDNPQVFNIVTKDNH